jgi:hypothetical protein
VSIGEDVRVPDATDVAEPLVHTCPRCALTVASRFYGPCEACRAELRVIYAGEARQVEVAEYVPKMNVTPNAVALKDG